VSLCVSCAASLRKHKIAIIDFNIFCSSLAFDLVVNEKEINATNSAIENNTNGAPKQFYVV
jgi:hypothetical protein